MYSATTGDVTALRRLHGGGSDMGARYLNYYHDYHTTDIFFKLKCPKGL